MVLVAVPAHAERWPASACADVAQLKDIVSQNYSGARKQAGKYPLLTLLRDHCGVDTTAEMHADKAGSRGAPVICNTMKIDGSLSTTACN